jgi:hypothetical protein
MIYKFKSKATGSVLMLEPNGEQFLRALGREPAARGIIEVEQMPQALQMLARAIEADDAARGSTEPADEDAAGGARDPVSLRRRLWPMVQMLERALAAREAVVWGV